MKLTYFFFLITLFQIHANSYGQNAKVTLNLENVSVEKAFDEIEKITDYRFLYNISNLNLNRKVSLNYKKEPLKNILNHLFKSTNIAFKVLENQIVLKIAGVKAENIANQKIQQTISGKITDDTGSPLPGVTVLVAGTQRGAVSDFDGAFTIQALEGDLLVFSYLGFTDYEVEVTSQQIVYNVKMEPSTLALDQVVISTGYQNILEEQSTGSYSVVKNKVLETKINQNILSKIANEVPGLLVDNNQGILVRGSASINGTVEPLIVVDGIATPEGFSFTDINPNDVKSITVLKDAATASIWGIRSANGVIVIVTKKGSRNNKTRIEASINSSYTPKLNLFNTNIANTSTQINFQRDLFNAQNTSFSTTELASESRNVREFFQLNPVIEALLNEQNGSLTQSQVNQRLNALKLIDVRDEYSNEILRPTLWNQYSLAISGGGEKQDYRASLTFNDNDFGFINGESKQVIFNLRNTFDISEKLTARFIGNFSQSKRNLGPSSPNDALSILNGDPTTPGGFLANIPLFSRLLDNNGNYNPLVGGASRDYSNYLLGIGVPYDYTYNVLQEYDNADNRIDDVSLRLQAGLDYNITEGLDATLTYQYILGTNQTKNLFNENTFGTRSRVNLFSQIDPTTNTVTNNILDEGSILEDSFFRRATHTLRGQVNFEKAFNDDLHKINAIGGYEVSLNLEKNDSRRLYGYNDTSLAFSNQVDYSTQFPNFFANAPFLTNTVQVPFGNTVFEDQDRFYSYYFNGVYTYNEKYTFSGSIRLDDTNLLGASEEFRNIPQYSFGLRWNMKDEFFKDNSSINNLSLRGSYGVNGNLADENRGGLLLARTRNNFGTYTNRFSSISNIPNNQLQLEKVFTTNIGLDFRLYNFFSGTIEGYRAISKELFSSISLNPTLGVSQQELNVGELTNTGVDINLSFDFNKPNQKFGYFTTLNFSVNKNELTKVEFSSTDINSRINGTIAIQGESLSTIFSYKYAGLDTNGRPQYFDENNNIVDFNTDINRVEALKKEGTLIPKYYGSWINELSFKDFSLRVLTSFRAGHVFRYNNRFIPGQRSDIANVTRDYNNVWQVPGDEAFTSIPRIPSTDDIGQFGYQNYDSIDTFVDDASHIKLDQINLGYSLPNASLKAMGIENINIGFQVDNVAVWSFNRWNVDPENQFFPRQRTFSLNINTRF